MKILGLDLIAYGPFENVSLDLSEGSHGLHLVYGDNEAGKSSTLRALLAWLYGISTRTPDAFRHDYSQLRVGGGLQLQSGEELRFIRKKGRKNTLLDPDSSDVLEDARLARFLAGVDRESFERLYGIDHARLVEGGQAILLQSGVVGEALFSAALGTAGLRNVLDTLKGEAEDLFRPRASKSLINKAVSEHGALKKKIKEAGLLVSEWKDLKSALARLEDELEQVKEEIHGLTVRQSCAARLKRTLGPLADLQVVRARIAALGEVVRLPKGFPHDRVEIQQELRVQEEIRRRAEARLEELRTEAAAISLRPVLLANGERIGALTQEIVLVDKASLDHPQQVAKLANLRDQARKQLKSIRPDISVEAVEELRPLLNNQEWITELIRRRDGLDQGARREAEAINEAAAALEKLEEQQESLGRGAADVSELKAAVVRVRKDGDMEEQAARAARDAEEQGSECRLRLKQLGRFHGDPEAFEELTLPLSEAVDEFHERFLSLKDRDQKTSDRRQQIVEERAELEGKLAALLSTGEVPSEKDLGAVRGLREERWREVRRCFIDGDPEGEDAADPGLPGAFEETVARADEVGDRLRMDADRVQQRAFCEAQLEKLQVDSHTLDEQAAANDEERARFQREWAAVWADLDVEPDNPFVMKHWLLEAEGLSKQLGQARRARIEAERLGAMCQAHQDLLMGRLIPLVNTETARPEGLSDLLLYAEGLVSEEESRARARDALRKELAAATERLNGVRGKKKVIEADLSAWREEWSLAIQGLGISPDLPPDKAAGTMARLVDFFDKVDEAEALEGPVSLLAERIHDFEQRVAAVAGELGFQNQGEAATVVAAGMNAALTQAREDRTKRSEIEKKIAEQEQARADAAVAIEDLLVQLQGLCRTAGVDDAEGLSTAEERAAALRSQEEKLDSLTKELSRSSDGLALEALEQEAAGVDRDRLAAELESVQAELGALYERREELSNQRHALGKEIAGKDGGAAAAQAAEEAEQKLADIVDGTERYLRVEIASLILKQQIERYRKEHQAPLLTRASALFQRLTLGSFCGLRDELNDKGKPVLHGLRDDNREVPVEGMSEGTRDQLFLALRLATLEQHVQSREPMPFVVDDILVGFDDARTRACLEVLAELSRKTQVLLFTHHRRVVDLSAALGRPEDVFVHKL